MPIINTNQYKMSKKDKIEITKDIGSDLKQVQGALYSDKENLQPKLPKGAKLKKLTLTPNLCISLIWIYKYYRHNENAQEGQYFTRKDFFSDLISDKTHKNKIRNFRSLHYWDLITKMPLHPTKIIYKKGYYGLTENGIAFVQQEIAMCKHALVYNDFAYEHETTPVMIKDVLEEAGYDYNELLLP